MGVQLFKQSCYVSACIPHSVEQLGEQLPHGPYSTWKPCGTTKAVRPAADLPSLSQQHIVNTQRVSVLTLWPHCLLLVELFLFLHRLASLKGETGGLSNFSQIRSFLSVSTQSAKQQTTLTVVVRVKSGELHLIPQQIAVRLASPHISFTCSFCVSYI